jgi:hypothetical protein
MEFTLIYRGELKANGSVEHKQDVRRAIHRQLKEWWKQTPFDELKQPSEDLTRRIGGFRFFPVVTEARREVAELYITMLRPEPPGRIISQGGDIDNRLKTLFDSLRMPKVVSEIPPNAIPAEDEDPFFCLLEDDRLITKISVSTDQLLEPCIQKSDVSLLIHVQIRWIEMIGGNMIITMERVG